MSYLDNNPDNPVVSWIQSQSDLMLMLDAYSHGKMTKEDIQSYSTKRATGRGNIYDDY